VVGVFAADPFLNCKRIADHLIAKGYAQVTNIPPAAGYGSEFLATLDKVASGQAQEQRNIAQLADRGLSVSPAVAAIDGLPAALAWLPHGCGSFPASTCGRGRQSVQTGSWVCVARW
jgi:predicted TIM-barrel enzyme